MSIAAAIQETLMRLERRIGKFTRPDYRAGSFRPIR